MIQTINTEVTNKKLQSEVSKYNDAATDHRKQVEASSQPLEAADVLTVTPGELDKLKSDRSVEKLATLQDAIRLEEQRLEIIQKLQPELDKAADAAAAELQTTIQTVSEHMDACGFGLDTMPASSKGFDRIAKRQFDTQVQQSEPVKISTENMNQARSVATKNLDQVRQSVERLKSHNDELNQFVAAYLNN